MNGQARSAAWGYFEEIQQDGKPLRQCRLCTAKLAPHTVSNLKTHLAKKHTLTASIPPAFRPPGSKTIIELVNELDAKSGRPVPGRLQKEIARLDNEVSELKS